MGLATAQAAARDGAAVTVVSSRPERVDAALAELPDGCDGAVLDVRDEHAIAALFERVGELDHLVFTAGDAFTSRRLAEMSPAKARAVLDVRFWGAVEVIRSAGSTHPHGRLDRPDDRNGRAAASARSCASGRRGRRRRGSGARAGGRARPGARQRGAAPAPSVRRFGTTVPEPQREAVFARLAQRTLLGTIGEPEEIALAHLYLMQNRYVTGTVLTIDGGLLLAG